MTKLLYFALLFGVFHNLGFIPALVAAYQEYNWDKITFKVNDTVDYIIKVKKNVYVKIEKIIVLSILVRPRRAQQHRTKKTPGN